MPGFRGLGDSCPAAYLIRWSQPALAIDKKRHNRIAPEQKAPLGCASISGASIRSPRSGARTLRATLLCKCIAYSSARCRKFFQPVEFLGPPGQATPGVISRPALCQSPDDDSDASPHSHQGEGNRLRLRVVFRWTGPTFLAAASLRRLPPARLRPRTIDASGVALRRRRGSTVGSGRCACRGCRCVRWATRQIAGDIDRHLPNSGLVAVLEVLGRLLGCEVGQQGFAVRRHEHLKRIIFGQAERLDGAPVAHRASASSRLWLVPCWA